MPFGTFYASLTPTLRGMLFMGCSTMAVASMNGVIRFLTHEVHPFEIAFFRNFIGVLLFAPMFVRHGFAPLRTTKLPWHALRAFLNVISMLAFFVGLKVEVLAKVTALSFTSPLFASMLAIIVLRERARLRRWVGLFVGLSGALIILRPGVEPISLGASLVLTSSFIWAITLMVIKVLSRTDSALTIAFYAALLMVPMSFVPALFVWSWPTPEQYAWLALVAVFATIGQVCLAQAFREADVSAVLPVDFTKLIWAVGIGIVFFAEIPTVWTLSGGAVIAGSVLYVAYRERIERGLAERRGAGRP